MPIIGIEIEDNDFWVSGVLDVQYTIDRTSDLISGSMLKYIFYPHFGFDYGQSFQWTMPNALQVNLNKRHLFAPNVPVITVGAALDMTFQSFQKRVVNQLTRSRAKDVLNSQQLPARESTSYEIFPNPSRESIMIRFNDSPHATSFAYVIYNGLGIAVQSDRAAQWNDPIDMSACAPGIYFLLIDPLDGSSPGVRKFTKQKTD